MKRKMFKLSWRICALFLTVIMLLSAPFSGLTAAAQSPEELARQSQALITRGEFVMLMNNALMLQEKGAGENFSDVSADHPRADDLLIAKAAGYISGNGAGGVLPDKVISGAEAAVMINNLLGFDGSKVEQVKTLAVPAWAVPSASVLLDLTMVDKAMLEKQQLTVWDALGLVGATSVALMFQGSPYALIQASPEDDFFAYVNRQFQATATIPPGYMFVMSFTDTNLVVESQQRAILAEILSSPNPAPGSENWIISELYKMFLDNKARTESLSKLQPYLDEIRAAKTINELLGVAKKHTKYFNLQPFYGMSVAGDAMVDATKWCTIIMPSPLDLGSGEYFANDPSLAGVQNAYKALLADMLAYLGETANLESRAEALYLIEKERAAKMLPSEAYFDPQVQYKKTTWEKMLDITKTTNSLTYDEEIYNIMKDKSIYCPDLDYIIFIESLYTEKNLQALKDVAMLTVLSTFQMVLGDDLRDLSDGLTAALLGETGEKASLEQRAQTFVTTMMMQTFSKKYAEKYCSAKVKTDVSEIVEDVRAKYRERIMSLEWMSDETKSAAVEKLNAVKAFVAYPDKPIQAVTYEVKAKDQGGCLVDLYFSLLDLNHREGINLLKKPLEINLWEHIPTSTVNAFYAATENAIIIPAGILQGVFYSPKASREQNLGAIGAVIAHEFTHAFDNIGARYDKNGTITNWWTDNDYKSFDAMAADVAKALSAIAFVGDIRVNGVLCTPETISDLGAIACVLDIADDTPGADLAGLMESWAAIWAARMSQELAVYLLYMDSHLPNKLRVNFVLSQVDDFYDVFNIKEGDGMYTPAEKRLSIW